MREAATGKRLKLPIDVVLHAPDGRLGLIEQEVGSAAIAVVRKTDAACVGDDHSGDAPNVGAMDMPIDGNLLAERCVNRLQLGIAGFRRGCAPGTLGAGMDERHRRLNLHARQSAQPGEPLFSQRCTSGLRHFLDRVE